MTDTESRLSASGSPSPEREALEKDAIHTEAETAEPDAEYPQGISLALIVVAVVLAIFLISLDQVQP